LKPAPRRGLPPIQVSPNQGKFLHLLAQAIGARTILEIGTLGGYSASGSRGRCLRAALDLRLEADPPTPPLPAPTSLAPGLADVRGTACWGGR